MRNHGWRLRLVDDGLRLSRRATLARQVDQRLLDGGEGRVLARAAGRSRSIPGGRSALLSRNASRIKPLEAVAGVGRADLLARQRDPQPRMIAAVFDRRKPPGSSSALDRRRWKARRKSLGSFSRSWGRKSASWSGHEDRPLASGSSRAFGRSAAGSSAPGSSRPRRTRCQIKRTPIAARVTRAVPSKPATARPSRGRASGSSLEDPTVKFDGVRRPGGRGLVAASA